MNRPPPCRGPWASHGAPWASTSFAANERRAPSAAGSILMAMKPRISFPAAEGRGQPCPAFVRHALLEGEGREGLPGNTFAGSTAPTPCTRRALSALASYADVETSTPGRHKSSTRVGRWQSARLAVVARPRMPGATAQRCLQALKALQGLGQGSQGSQGSPPAAKRATSHADHAAIRRRVGPPADLVGLPLASPRWIAPSVTPRGTASPGRSAARGTAVC